jgi:hypothetical protein
MTQRLASAAGAALLLLGSASAKEVFVFPKEGQDEQQMQRDESECAAWAKQQTGFDPAKPPSLDQLMAEAQSGQPQTGGGAAVAAGAAKGAITGSAIGKWTDNDRTQYGAAGAFIGSVRAARRQEQAAAQRQSQARQQAESRMAEMHDAYNRAYGACLEGKGYTVR